MMAPFTKKGNELDLHSLSPNIQKDTVKMSLIHKLYRYFNPGFFDRQAEKKLRAQKLQEEIRMLNRQADRYRPIKNGDFNRIVNDFRQTATQKQNELNTLLNGGM